MASGSVSVRLPDEIMAQIEQIAESRQAKVSDVVRELIVAGLGSSGEDEGIPTPAPAVMEVPWREMEERLAVLLGRVILDIGIINQMSYRRIPKEERKDLWEESARASVERLRVKLKAGDPEATKLVALARTLQGE